jgi:hypothetical protein
MALPSLKLTVTMRNTLLEKIVQNPYPEEHKVLQKEADELFNDIYLSDVPVEKIELAKKLGQRYLKLDSALSISLNSGLGRGWNRLSLRIPKDYPHAFTSPIKNGPGILVSGFNGTVLTQENPFWHRSHEYLDKSKELRKKVSDLREQVQGILDSANTTLQMKQIWPEVSSIVDDLVKSLTNKTDSTTVLSPKDVDVINQVCKLPRPPVPVTT